MIPSQISLEKVKLAVLSPYLMLAMADLKIEGGASMNYNMGRLVVPSPANLAGAPDLLQRRAVSQVISLHCVYGYICLNVLLLMSAQPSPALSLTLEYIC